VNVTIVYSPSSCSNQVSVTPGNAATVDLGAVACLSDGFQGSATLTSSPGGLIAAAVEYFGSGAQMTYSGFADGASRLYFPLVVGRASGHDSLIAVTALGSTPTGANLTYLPGAGLPGTPCTSAFSLTPGQPQLVGVPAACGPSFIGSAVLRSDGGGPLAAVQNVFGQSGFAAYRALSSPPGATRVAFPLVRRDLTDLTSFIAVQNAGTGPAAVSVAFAARGGAASGSTGLSLPADGAALVDTSVLADGFQGSAVITSSQPVTAVLVNLPASRPPSGDELSAYEGMDDDSPGIRHFFPLTAGR
jgi:hypothetical protein